MPPLRCSSAPLGKHQLGAVAATAAGVADVPAPAKGSARLAAVLASSSHDRLLPGRNAKAAFAQLLNRVPTKNSSPVTLSGHLPDYMARYTGGIILLPPIAHGNTVAGEMNFTHLDIAFPGLPVGDPDVCVLATIQTLLGGGAVFSTGGPGKGMCSRLFTEVLNKHHWVKSCVAFNHTYSDSGLFGISASCLPAYARLLPSVIAAQLAALLCPFVDPPPSAFTAPMSHHVPLVAPHLPVMYVPRRPITAEDLSRARKQLRSKFLMNLENHVGRLDDMARQVLLFGGRIPVRETCDRIEAVTLHDMRRVAERVLVDGPMRVIGASAWVASKEAYSRNGRFWETLRTKYTKDPPKERSEIKTTASMPLAAKMEGGGMTIVACGHNLDHLGDVIETFANYGIGYRNGYPYPLPTDASREWGMPVR